jgi:hypothetical protein
MSSGPEPCWTRRFTFQLSPETLHELGKEASLDGVSIAAFVRRLIISEMALRAERLALRKPPSNRP